MSDEGVGSAREEAERLVAAGLGALSTALQGMQLRQQLRDLVGDDFAGHMARDPAAFLSAVSTGSPDCCICPLCRVIAALRDPSPEFAERLATGVGDLAVGLAGVLRAFSGALAAQEGRPDAAPHQGQPGAAPHQAEPGAAPHAARPGAAPHQGQRGAAAQERRPGDGPGAGEPGDGPAVPPPRPPKPMAKKALKKAPPEPDDA